MKISREKLISYIMKCRSAFMQREQAQGTMVASRQLVMDAKGDYVGVTNEFLTALCSTLLGEAVEVFGAVEELLPCPCCGYLTLTEIGNSYEICRLCNWENDGDTDPNVYKGINKGSMLDYRKRKLDFPNRFMR